MSILGDRLDECHVIGKEQLCIIFMHCLYSYHMSKANVNF